MEKLLSVDEVAEILGVPKATIYRWRYIGTGPRGIPVGRYVRFRPAEVERWLSEVERAFHTQVGGAQA